MKTFLISDTHFGHNNCYTFTDDAGKLIRPWAKNADEGDEIMVENWNSVVKPEDKVYHLGDVAIPRHGLRHVARLNGRKVLIKGNHDHYKLKEYAELFDDVRGAWKLGEFWLTHIPVHPESIRWKGNIHGHLHAGRVMSSPHHIDPRYVSVCVEQINATPIDFEEIVAAFKGNH